MRTFSLVLLGWRWGRHCSAAAQPAPPNAPDLRCYPTAG